jgi:DNA-binding transcriptional ArsR family regulator
VLRIHFTDRDLSRTTVAAGPDPLWETVLGLHQLAPAPRSGHRNFAAWRRRAMNELEDRHLKGALRALLTIAPARAGYFPDFLTPPAAASGLADGVDALRGTPRDLVTAEMTRALADRRTVRPWVRELAVGDAGRLAELADAVTLLHDAVIAPGWTAVDAVVEADRAARARALRDGGVHGLLSSLGPHAVWEPPVLTVRYCESRDLWLGGRGLRLVPSRFCWRMPIALADPELPQVLVYPAAGEAFGAVAVDPEPAGDQAQLRSLSVLLGRTRARVLLATDAGATTGEISRRLSVSAATTSEHVTALRSAGLVLSRRTGGRVLHTLTPLGDALLRGRL